MSTCPKILSSQYAYDMAQVILDGFNRLYRIFRESSLEAKHSFESQNWLSINELIKRRIDYYDDRVKECIVSLEDEFDAINLDSEIWQQVKLHYIGFLTDHPQPKSAETFFNSVVTKVLHPNCFHNDFIFIRPTISTECKIRNVPIPRTEEEEMSEEICYHVGPKDIFPSTFDTFLLGDTRVRKYLIKHHADFFLLDTSCVIQNQLHKGSIPDLFSNPKHLRFINKHLSSSIERV